MSENIAKFIDAISKSLSEETFVKLTLGNYKGSDEQLQKLSVRLLETKKGLRLFFQFRYDTRDVVKNYSFDEGLEQFRKLFGTEFFSGHLFTTANDFQLGFSKKGKSRLNIGKPTFTARPSLEHDREKRLQIDPGSFYLKALGITNDHGDVRAEQQDKWRQINKFVEILADLFEKSELRGRKGLTIVDMGSGKGYLTFAAYDYFANILPGRNSSVNERANDDLYVHMTGIDTKREMVELCNSIAKASEFEGLKFVEGTIANFDLGEVDILIALHACDTATDDALFKGIRANAEIIIAAPCCHREIRPQIKPPAMFKDILKHGTMLERTAETITDGLRSLLLERSGYKTKVFEFVSVEHTPKNNMIVAVKSTKPLKEIVIGGQIDEIKRFYGIESQRLETLLT